MHRTFALFLLLLACRPASAHPVTFPSFAQQCVPVRQVACTFDAPVCALLVAPAVAEMNTMVGRTVFEYAGVLSHEGAQHAYDTGVLVIGPGKLPTGVLGVTVPHVVPRAGRACIERVLIALDSKQAFAPEIEPRRVLLHEMTHALGFDHAPDRSWYRSPMAAVYDGSAEWGPADIATLRSVY